VSYVRFVPRAFALRRAVEKVDDGKGGVLTVATMATAIVVSGATHGLGVVRSLGREGVPVTVVSYDSRDIAPSSRYVRRVVRAPHPDRDEARFVAVLLEEAGRCPGSLLIPASDAALGSVARHKATLENGGLIVASDDAEVTETLLNKAKTLELARSAAVPGPATFTPSNEQDVRRFCASAEFPAVLKPELSHIYRELVGVKWSRVDSTEEAVRAYAVARSHSLDVVLQELIPGDELCGVVYNSYFWKGEPLVEFTSRKVRNSPPDTGSPSVVVSEWIPEVAEQGRRLLHAAKFSGYSCTEFKRDPRDGEYKVMEVNARHNLSSLLATRCGLNFPWMQYQHLVDGLVPVQRDYEQGIYWIDVTRDLQNLRHYLQRPGYSLGDFLEPYRRSCVFAVLDRHDVGPAAARGLDTLRVATGRLRSRSGRPKSGSAAADPAARRGPDRSSAARLRAAARDTPPP
jgi:predicted ATP-grasp superfamily ATP-dependent carboligase